MPPLTCCCSELHSRCCVQPASELMGLALRQVLPLAWQQEWRQQQGEGEVDPCISDENCASVCSCALRVPELSVPDLPAAQKLPPCLLLQSTGGNAVVPLLR